MKKDQPNDDFRCGYIAIIGRPNVGKSTLMNELIGAKVSITSKKAQTTRHRILGIQTDEEAQFIYVDTPGFQTRYNNALNKNLNRTVTNTLQTADVVLFLIEAGSFSKEDETVLNLLPKKVPTLLVINKTDKVTDKESLFTFAEGISKKHVFEAVIPISARKRFQLRELEEEIRKLLPQNPPLFHPDDTTDKSERFMAAEIIREKIFRFCGDELPYTSTVVIEHFEKKEKIRRIFAAILVERVSHKAMMIGYKGERLKEMSTEARMDMEKMFGTPVYLEIWVKVKSGWADNEEGLKAYGYE